MFVLQLHDAEAQSSPTGGRPFSSQSRIAVAVSCACAVLCIAIMLACCYRLSVLERKFDALYSQRPHLGHHDTSPSVDDQVGNMPTTAVRTQVLRAFWLYSHYLRSIYTAFRLNATQSRVDSSPRSVDSSLAD